MALPLGKLTILIGAGLVGSVLAKEGRVSDILSGTFKIVLKQIRHDEPSVKPRNDSLMAQVSSLRQELQMLASNRSITVVTANGPGAGAGKYSYIVVVVVVGYGYIWWKGWKLPDMMFATKRGLSDACNTVAKQLENVYTSIAAAKRQLSSKIDSMDHNVETVGKITAETETQVSDLSVQMKDVGLDVNFIREKVQTMETKIYRIVGKQDLTNEGVRRLCNYARSMENGRTTQRIQASSSSASRPALERSRIVHLSRTGSMPPPLLPAELSSASASNKQQKELQRTTEAIGTSSNPGFRSDSRSPEETRIGHSGSGRFGRMLSGFSASVIPRTRSATQGVIQQLGRQTSGLGTLTET